MKDINVKRTYLYCLSIFLTHEIFRHIWYIITPDSRQSKTLILSMNVDQNSFDTDFSIVICHQSGDK